MSGEGRSAGTLGDVLASRRRRRFVGRVAEVELFRSALEGSEPPFSVLSLHGPGGIGKTSLLEVFAQLAAAAGCRVVRLDGRDLPPTPAAVTEVMRRAGLPGGTASPGEPPDRLVVLLDSYERLAPLDEWVRTSLLPDLPATALAVIAGRSPLGPAWRADPAWRDLLRIVSLRNLSPEESRRYLRECGVEPGLHDRMLEVAYGNPLGLSLLTDVVLRDRDALADPLGPDLVGALLRRFVEAVPAGPQRRALEVCALARVTTEDLLRGALGIDDANELFAWLRALSFVESGPEGILPHDLARDALAADLRWRDPEGYKRVVRSVRAHVHGRLASAVGRERQQVLFDEKFLFRNLPGVASPVDWDAWGRHHPQPARPSERRAILDLVAAAEGPEAAAIAERWLERQPGGFFVLRREDGTVRGFLGLLDLTAASGQDRAADPGAQAAWEHAQRTAPPRPGEVVTQSRFIVDAEAYQAPSPTLNAVPIVTLERYLDTPNLAWDFLTLAEPEAWDDYFALADLPRAVGADFVVGDRRYGIFGHDFRRVPVDALLELWTERALSQEPGLPPPSTPQVLVLSQEDFTDAVRQALRDLTRPDLLARNPLLRTRLVRGCARTGDPDAAVLDGLLREAVGTLRRHPRDDKLLRAVERTYVRPAATQESAAALLGLPFSTYRRHLSQGVARVVAWLWEREVLGPEPGAANPAERR